MARAEHPWKTEHLFSRETGYWAPVRRIPVQRPPGAEIIDLSGKTIIPALISAHSHLGLCKGIIGPRPENYTHENVQHQLEQYERYGVLTVMSLGVNKDVLYAWRDEQREGKLDGADIFTADRGLGVPRGAPPFPFLEDQVYRPTSVAEARADVRESAGRHPDMIKLWMDDLIRYGSKNDAGNLQRRDRAGPRDCG